MDETAETLIPEKSHLIALAELELCGNINYDSDGLYLTEKGYDKAWDYIQEIPQPFRSLIALFFAYLSEKEYDDES